MKGGKEDTNGPHQAWVSVALSAFAYFPTLLHRDLRLMLYGVFLLGFTAFVGHDLTTGGQEELGTVG